MTTRASRGQRHTDTLVRAKLREIGRLALIQATTMDPVLSRALRAAVPEVTSAQTVVRREFAAQLRTIAGKVDQS
ncbi:hypothetical protein ABTX35_39260 [Streptomyces sp. NPDC096080]|uniref:hypothetical protein n=1 Tax=Streptomyces sp. NPDC096080 TaxID=3156693 RepID=UPI00331BBF95